MLNALPTWPYLPTLARLELAHRAQASGGRLAAVTYRGVLLATAAMLVRNAVILSILALSALVAAAVPLAFMLTGVVAAALIGRLRQRDADKLASASNVGEPLPTLARRDAHGENRPDTDRTLHCDGATQYRGELAHDVEAQSHAAGASRA
jgi:hypothetical protein